MQFGPLYLTGEVSVGALSVLVTILLAALGWHRRMAAMETKVNIMFTWWVSQMPDVQRSTVERFLQNGKGKEERHG